MSLDPSDAAAAAGDAKPGVRPGREIDRQIGARLRAAREARKASIVDVANRCEISGLDLADWEAGTTRPPPEALVAVAKALQVSLAHLLVGE